MRSASPSHGANLLTAARSTGPRSGGAGWRTLSQRCFQPAARHFPSTIPCPGMIECWHFRRDCWPEMFSDPCANTPPATCPPDKLRNLQVFFTRLTAGAVGWGPSCFLSRQLANPASGCRERACRDSRPRQTAPSHVRLPGSPRRRPLRWPRGSFETQYRESAPPRWRGPNAILQGRPKLRPPPRRTRRACRLVIWGTPALAAVERFSKLGPLWWGPPPAGHTALAPSVPGPSPVPAPALALLIMSTAPWGRVPSFGRDPCQADAQPDPDRSTPALRRPPGPVPSRGF